MKISYDRKTVTFKTIQDNLFEAEKSGTKANTVRIIDADELKQLKKQEPEKIIIQHNQEIISRILTHVFVSEEILGKYLAVFSWNQIDMSQSAILLPRTLIHRLIGLAGNRPLPEFIASMVNLYSAPLHQQSPDRTFEDEEVKLDKMFTTVSISKLLLYDLERISHGRTVNMTIGQLYKEHVLAESEPTHD